MVEFIFSLFWSPESPNQGVSPKVGLSSGLSLASVGCLFPVSSLCMFLHPNILLQGHESPVSLTLLKITSLKVPSPNRISFCNTGVRTSTCEFKVTQFKWCICWLVDWYYNSTFNSRDTISLHKMNSKETLWSLQMPEILRVLPESRAMDTIDICSPCTLLWPPRRDCPCFSCSSRTADSE